MRKKQTKLLISFNLTPKTEYKNDGSVYIRAI